MRTRNLSAIALGLAAIAVSVAILFQISPRNSTPVRSVGWSEEGGQKFYYHSDGSPAVGWEIIDNLRYFFDPDGIMATGWLEEGGERYFLREDGSMVTGWLSLEGQRYYLKEDGCAVSGPCVVDGIRRIFTSDGLLASGPVQVGGTWYLADGSGLPQSGWAESGDVFRYFDQDGKATTGWATIGAFSYYFLEDGTPAAGEVEIDGQIHHFSPRGQKILLVNAFSPLPEDYTVELCGIGGRHQIALYAYDDFQQMMDDCRAAGHRPAVCSSYRSLDYQQGLFDRKINYYLKRGYSREESEALAGKSIAIPGTSEHQLGLALDIVDNSYWGLDERQKDTPAQQWLLANSWRYGFVLRYPEDKRDITGIIYEPWHYRYVGREAAKEMYETGLCLEEYLEFSFG